MHIKMKIVDNTFIARERKTIKYSDKNDVFHWNSWFQYQKAKVLRQLPFKLKDQLTHDIHEIELTYQKLRTTL